MKVDDKSLRLAESFVGQAFNKAGEARTLLLLGRYPGCISAAQDCIELATKAIFLILKGEYPREHEFKDEDLEEIIDKVPEDLGWVEFHRLIVFNKLWPRLRALAKYGHEKLSLGPEKFFERKEAELAVKHAEECYEMAHRLLYRAKYPPPKVEFF